MTRYRLRSHAEEFHCPECGEPVYVGEHAVEHEENRFCSRHCAEVAAAAVLAATGWRPRPTYSRSSRGNISRPNRWRSRYPGQSAIPTPC